MPGDVDLEDLPYEDLLSDDVELEKKAERESRKRQELLAKVDFSRCAISLLVILLGYSVRRRARPKVKAVRNAANFFSPLSDLHQLKDPGWVGKHTLQ